MNLMSGADLQRHAVRGPRGRQEGRVPGRLRGATHDQGANLTRIDRKRSGDILISDILDSCTLLSIQDALKGRIPIE